MSRPRLQEIFDKVVTHLRTQRYQCLDDAGVCMYRYNDGLSLKMCAAGCLIPDGDYDPNWEETTIADKDEDNVEEFNSITQYFLSKYNNDFIYIVFIRKLQSIHDVLDSNINDWEPQFNTLARQYSLTIPPK